MADSNMKRIPYGVADILEVQKANYYYIDKTSFLPKIEQAGKFLFFIRPRRFGKSLWLSVLESYYDVAAKDQFEAVFGSTFIGSNPTDERNSYLILSLNFSLVNPDIGLVEKSFEDHVRLQIRFFCKKYRNQLGEDVMSEIIQQRTSYDQFAFLCKSIKERNLKLYLLLDEYDNFANTILSTQGHDKYRDLTHGTGFFKYFFNVLKGGTTGSGAGLSRMFITGVSPITMDDVTSGFNIGNNISLDNNFNTMLGITNEEFDTLLDYYQGNNVIKEQGPHLRKLMRQWYNNYQFSKSASEKVFNTDMVLYCLNKILTNNEIPDDLIDPNVKTDYKKLRHLIVLDQRLNGNFSRLKQIEEEKEIAAEIVTSFPIEEMNKPDNFVSLLFYLGLLTIDRYEKGSPVLRIPNLVIQKLFYTYLRDAYKDVNFFKLDVWHFGNLMRAMAYDGDWQPVFAYLTEQIEQQTSIRDYLQGEKMIQGFLLAYMNITDHFITRSEFELGKGFVDIYCEPFLCKYADMPFSYLIELKYLTREKTNEQTIASAAAEAREQIERYYAANQSRIQSTQGPATLKKIILIYSGWELIQKMEVE